MDQLDLVVGRRVADVLDLDVVLVGPEEGHRRERRRGGRASMQVVSGVVALLGRVRPVLDADVGTDQGGCAFLMWRDTLSENDSPMVRGQLD